MTLSIYIHTLYIRQKSSLNASFRHFTVSVCIWIDSWHRRKVTQINSNDQHTTLIGTCNETFNVMWFVLKGFIAQQHFCVWIYICDMALPTLWLFCTCTHMFSIYCFFFPYDALDWNTIQHFYIHRNRNMIKLLSPDMYSI